METIQGGILVLNSLPGDAYVWGREPEYPCVQLNIED